MDFIYFGTGLALMLLSGSFSSNAGVDVSTTLLDKCTLLPDEALDVIYQRRPYVLLLSKAGCSQIATRQFPARHHCRYQFDLDGAGWHCVSLVAHHRLTQRDGDLLGWCMYAFTATLFAKVPLCLHPFSFISVEFLYSFAWLPALLCVCASDNLTAAAEQFAASHAVYGVDRDGSSSASEEDARRAVHLAFALTNSFSVCCLTLGVVLLTSCGALFAVSGVVGTSSITSGDEEALPTAYADTSADEWSVTTSSSRPTSLSLCIRPSREMVQVRASPARQGLPTVPEVSKLSINESEDAMLNGALLETRSEQSPTRWRLRSFALGMLALLSQVWIWFGLTTVFQGLCNGGLTTGCPDIWQQISYVATGHFIASASGAFITPPSDDSLQPDKHGIIPTLLHDPMLHRSLMW